MKILKFGKLPAPRIRHARCLYCGCEFTVDKNDVIEVFSDQRENEYYEWIKCPTEGCNRPVTLPGKKWEYE